jgi:hypothetical protein
MEVHRRLWHLCQWNLCPKVARILKCNKKLDLTYSEGEYFMFAMKYNNIEMLDMLLKYYRKTKLKEDDNSVEYKVANIILLKSFGVFCPIATFLKRCGIY